MIEVRAAFRDRYGDSPPALAWVAGYGKGVRYHYEDGTILTGLDGRWTIEWDGKTTRPAEPWPVRVIGIVGDQNVGDLPVQHPEQRDPTTGQGSGQ